MTAESVGAHPDPYRPIGDYALIGNCRVSALVSRDGSIDWLCLPRFDSPSLFAALLDAEIGGCFRIRPTGVFTSQRSYLFNTPIVETTFQTPTGKLVLRDFFAVASEEDKNVSLVPCHELLRQVEGLEGEVELELLYRPRPGYGLKTPSLEERGDFGFWCLCVRGAVVLRSEIPLRLQRENSEAGGTALIRAGEKRWLSLGYSAEAPAVIPALGEAAVGRYRQTLAWWSDWESCCSYRGPFREMVLRSAMVLKLMIYAPSGAVIAAPTTSLPERIGGIRNWDYRYCWLRDASFTLRALFSLGYHDDENAFLDWMLHLTRLTWPRVQVLYDVFGESSLPETELVHLDGYRHSRPVRVGNGAHEQFQLDVYGEVIESVCAFAGRGGNAFNRDIIRMLDGLGRTVCKLWRQPDDGIWEIRSGRVHHTHSKVLAWVALDRLIRLHGMGYRHISVELFRSEREKLRREIETRGFNRKIGSFASAFDGELVDSNLLVFPSYGFVEADDPRMRGTYARVREKLGRGSLLYRYERATDDGLPPGEGTFGICGFWGVDCQARGGDLDGACRNFEELVTFANDLGLFAEEIAPDGSALGNFPQAFTHIGLINAAVTLAHREVK